MSIAQPDPLPTYRFRRAGAWEPPAAYAWLRDERPAARVQLANGKTAWLLTRHEDARAALADRRLSAEEMHSVFDDVHEERTIKRHAHPGHFITQDSPGHEVIRRMLTAHFTVKRMETMGPAVQHVVDKLIDDMPAGPQPVDLAEA